MAPRNHKDKETADRSTFPLASCDRVFSIPELLEHILCYVGSFRTNDLRHCVLVCRRWHIYFAPRLWRTVKAFKKTHPIRKEIGLLVRHINTDYATRSLLKSVPELFPNVEVLHLVSRHNSYNIGYNDLRRMFARLQDRLTEVHLFVEKSAFDINILWSLAWVPRLIHLKIRTLFPSKEICNVDDVCNGILVCCLSLQSFEFEYTARETFVDAPHRSLRAWRRLRQGLAFMTGSTPSSPQEALANSRDTCSRRADHYSPRPVDLRSDSASPSVSRTPNSDIDNVGNNTNKDKSRSTLRRLSFKNTSPSTLAMHNILTEYGSQLEELDIGRKKHLSFSREAWCHVLEHCRFLCVLDIADFRQAPSIATLISLLPHLQVLSVTLEYFDCPHNGPDLSNLGASFERHRDQYGTIHPLRHLEIGSWFLDWDKVLLGIMSVTGPFQIEYLRFGCNELWCKAPRGYRSTIISSTSSCSGSPPLSPSPLTTKDVHRDAVASQRCNYNSLKKSFTQLDISLLEFVSDHFSKPFFEQVQKLYQLRVFRVDATHLWTLDRMNKDRNQNNGNSHNNITNNNQNCNIRSSSKSNSQQVNENENQEALPYTELCFPFVEDLIVRFGNRADLLPINYTPHYAITLPLALLVVAMMPSLQFFSLGDKGARGVRAALQQRFRGIVFEGC
ncbi:MAG: hypothetical protein J3R72DRAFT_195876 [Linnemannia gamsii]|nr:MAG: hypothetical protein J3R72DRAFT_195876 [Linnemannia gamsii]